MSLRIFVDEVLKELFGALSLSALLHGEAHFEHGVWNLVTVRFFVEHTFEMLNSARVVAKTIVAFANPVERIVDIVTLGLRLQECLKTDERVMVIASSVLCQRVLVEL